MTSTSRQFLTCQQAATEIKTLANTDVGQCDVYLADAKGLRQQAEWRDASGQRYGESYGYFYAGGMTAAQIMKNNITNSAVRQGIKVCRSLIRHG
jgi:conjugal transfer mating pair stabilization protein TraG